MKVFLVSLGLLFSGFSYSQNSFAYKQAVDSILLDRRHERVKVIKVDNDGGTIKYYYTKRGRLLNLISLTQKEDKTTWIYNYHFVDGKLTMINKWNGIPKTQENGKTSFYYLNGGELAYKEENNTKVDDLISQIKRAENLKSKAPTFQ